MAWLTDWTYRKKIAIQHANVDALLGDFPLYVGFCDDADLAGALATGYDVRFTQSDGETLLAYERESWSGGGANVTADFWVKVPSISAVAGTDIYVYWGKAGAADGQDAANAWNSSHLMVLHLNGNVLDSTGNGNDCTNYGTSSAPAAVSDGRSFDGSNDWIQTPLSVNYKTFSMWFQCDGWTSQRTPASHDESGSYAEDWTLYNYYTDSRLVLRCTSTFRTVLNPVGTGWYYITIAADGTNWKTYINGSQVDSFSKTALMGVGAINKLRIGRYAHLSSYFDGLADEVRVRSETESLAWHKFTYHNINEADNELTWESVEEAPSGGVSGPYRVSAGCLVGTGADAGGLFIPAAGAGGLFHATAAVGKVR